MLIGNWTSWVSNTSFFLLVCQGSCKSGAGGCVFVYLDHMSYMPSRIMSLHLIYKVKVFVRPFILEKQMFLDKKWEELESGFLLKIDSWNHGPRTPREEIALVCQFYSRVTVLVQLSFGTTWASLFEMELEPNSLDWNGNELEHELELENMKRIYSELSPVTCHFWRFF